MSANANIKILVDANEAVRNLKNVSNAVDGASVSFSKLADKTTGGFSQDSWKQVTAQIERQATAIKTFTPGMKGVGKAYEYVNAQALKLASNFQLTEEQIRDLIAQAEPYGTAFNAMAKSNKGFSNSVGSFTSKVGELLKNIMVFQVIIATVRKGMTAISNFFKDSAKAAAEAEQVYAKLTTVYDGFVESANESAKKLAQTIGVARSTASGALSTIGDLLQAQGMGVAESLETATRWAEQLQDIIAFKDLNMSLEEFAQTFMSGAAGNLRNFRTFGSIVKESAVQAELARKGYNKLTGSELELAKMTIRAEIALKQQANAIGATGREWDTVLSINRRLNEEQKRLNENVGTAMNESLKGIKKWWTEILEETNLAIEARRKYNELMGFGSSDTPKNQNQLEKQLKNLKYQVDSTGGAFFNFDTKSINALIQAYNVSVQEFLNAAEKVGIEISQSDIDLLKSQEETRIALESNTKALEDLKAANSNDADRYYNFLGNLNGIAGVNAQERTFTEGVLKNASNQTIKSDIDFYNLLDVKQASEQIMNATADSMSKSFEYALSDFSADDLLKAQVESMRKLAELAWNSFRTSGTGYTEAEDEVLQQIIENYKKLNAQLEENAQLEADKKAKQQLLDSTNKDLATLYTNTSRTNTDNALIKAYTKTGMSEDEAKIRVEWMRATQKVENDFKTLGKTTIDVNGELITQTQLQAQVDESYQNQIDAIDESTEELETFSDKLLGALGATGSLISIFEDLKNGDKESAGATAQDLLLQIVGQLAVVEQLNSWVDVVVSMLDAFLRPLEPAIEAILQILYSLAPIFDMLYPVIQIIATVIVMAAKMIETVLAAIQNVIIDIYNCVAWIWSGTKKRISYQAIWDDAADKLDKIWNSTYKIEKNTEGNDEIDYYKKLYDQGFINANEYQAMLGTVNGLRFDRLQNWEMGGYRNATGGQTVVYTGDMTFTVEGTNLSSDEIFEAYERWRARQLRAGAIAY